MAQLGLWEEDPYLKTLNRLVVKARINHSTLTRRNGRNESSWRQHKIICGWLIEEVSKACDNFPHWKRGQTKLSQLIQTKYRLQDYFDKTLDFPIDQIEAKFDVTNHEFFAYVTHIEQLFT